MFERYTVRSPDHEVARFVCFRPTYERPSWVVLLSRREATDAGGFRRG